MNLHDGLELLDVLDEAGQPTGLRKSRAEVHRDGDWHRSFHLWIVRERRYVLVQRRSRSKSLEPGKLDVSVGGHYRAGETLTEVIREAEEELGLVLRPEQLASLGTRRAARRYPEALDREVQHIYALCCEQPLEHYLLNCQEVSVLYEAPLDGLERLCREGGHLAVAGFDCQQRRSDALLIPEDLIPQAREDLLDALARLRAWLET